MGLKKNVSHVKTLVFQALAIPVPSCLTGSQVRAALAMHAAQFAEPAVVPTESRGPSSGEQVLLGFILCFHYFKTTFGGFHL